MCTVAAENAFDGGGDGDGRKEGGRWCLGSNGGRTESASVGNDVGAVSTVDGRRDRGPNLGTRGRRRRRNTQQSIGGGLCMRR